jgi:hypothetical protein
MIVVGVSGSREYPRLDLVRLRVRYRVELHGASNVVFVHGAARGVDRTADEAARELGAATRPLPVSNADWSRLGALAGHVRNVRLIQDEGIGALDGFWNLHSSGCAALARSGARHRRSQLRCHITLPAASAAPPLRALRARLRSTARTLAAISVAAAACSVRAPIVARSARLSLCTQRTQPADFAPARARSLRLRPRPRSGAGFGTRFSRARVAGNGPVCATPAVTACCDEDEMSQRSTRTACPTS